MKVFLACVVFIAALAANVEANCNDVFLASEACAMMYDEPNCKGQSYIVKFGAGNLPHGLFSKSGNKTDRHSSIIVRKGNSFRGYDVAANATDPKSKKRGAKKTNVQLIKDLGKKVIINANATRNVQQNFTKKFNDKISFVSCTKGLTKNCPAVPEHLCAICYDKPDCGGESSWSPLDIPITERYSLPSSLLGGPKNNIDSCSVRKGCSLTLIDTDTTPLKDRGNVTVTATRDDMHFNLGGNKDKKFKKLSDDVEDIICKCGKNTRPTFTFGIFGQ